MKVFRLLLYLTGNETKKIIYLTPRLSEGTRESQWLFLCKVFPDRILCAKKLQDWSFVSSCFPGKQAESQVYDGYAKIIYEKEPFEIILVSRIFFINLNPPLSQLRFKVLWLASIKYMMVYKKSATEYEIFLVSRFFFVNFYFEIHVKLITGW